MVGASNDKRILLIKPLKTLASYGDGSRNKKKEGKRYRFVGAHAGRKVVSVAFLSETPAIIKG